MVALTDTVKKPSRYSKRIFIIKLALFSKRIKRRMLMGENYYLIKLKIHCWPECTNYLGTMGIPRELQL